MSLRYLVYNHYNQFPWLPSCAALCPLCYASIHFFETPEAIESYKDIIETAKADLESHLETIHDKLQHIVGQTVTAEDLDTLELRRIKEEHMSTEKCLQICTQFFDHIDQSQLSTKSSNSSAGLLGSDTYPERVTDKSLLNCKKNLAGAITQLEKHMQDLTDRLLVKSKGAMTSEQRDNSRTGIFENCTSADLSTPVVVSTLERLILANKDCTKPSLRAMLGQMSDGWPSIRTRRNRKKILRTLLKLLRLIGKLARCRRHPVGHEGEHDLFSIGF